MDSFFALFGFAFVSLLIFLANLQQNNKFPSRIFQLCLLALASMSIVLGGLVLLSALATQAELPENDAILALSVIDTKMALIFFGASVLLGIFCIGLVFSRPLRLFMQRYLIRSDGQIRYYHADSTVHTTAVILAIFMIINTLGNFILAGGVEGLAESLEQTNYGVQDLLLNFGLYLISALLGIGFLVRRNFSQSLERLGISIPKNGAWGTWFANTLKYVLIGLIVGIGLFCLQIGMSLIWQAFVSPEALAEQTAATQQIFAAFKGSLWLGFILAITAGIGEELLFRGALQPILGNFLVSLFFVLLHSQYTLTPAALIILVVSLVFGLLRQHYTTTSAMAAHFMYNFSPFVLIYVLGQMGFSL